MSNLIRLQHNLSDNLNKLERKLFLFHFLLPAIISILILSSSIIFSQTIPENYYSGMQWRLVGPFRAGWATMAAGVPTAPNTFYFGAAGGGVWKTNDAGNTWQPLMQHEKSSAVGAIAVAPSNPKIIYVGTGQVALRYDILSGDGIYRSINSGKTWKNIGLDATHRIGKILIDPNNPDRVLVAALGQVFKPNKDRGIYLTTNGGTTWKHVLYVNDSTGAIDLASDSQAPQIIYAALWQIQMHPWLDYYDPQMGTGSGIYKSIDGGDHWEKLTGGGLPSGKLSRIGLAVANNSNGQIVYATVIAQGDSSGLYRSNNGGKSWTFINKDGALANSYFSRVTIDPKNANTVYIMGRSISRSFDGGKHFSFFKGAPGGDDYHYLWINPVDTTHMIAASDQGAVVTLNNGESWSSWYNQPTGQFYHLAVDNHFPYRIYSGQQDNGTVEILSRGPYGVIEDKDWHPVGGEERDYDVPKPDNSNLVFGSGLGGFVSRFDQKTRQVANVSPWPISSYGALPSEVRYRYTWITPLVFSQVKPYAMYFGAQVLFRSLDDGNHWKIVSPDLTGEVPDIKDYKNPTLNQAKENGYGTIFTIAPSPIDKNVIWIGTDNGVMQLSKDGGKHWNDVTPKLVPLWSRIDAIDPSPFSKNCAYAAVNTHRLGIFKPIIIKTKDDGKTWNEIVNGLPKDEFVNVVRTDPIRQGLLYAGTNRGVYVSFDDGQNWESLSLNFPTTNVTDLLVHDGDLIASTQGRAIWILDDIEPLREIANGMSSEAAHLFHPSPVWRMCGNENQDTPYPHEIPLGKNPPDGAIIDYWLKHKTESQVSLIIRDSNGKIVRSFTSGEQVKRLPANRYFEKGWVLSEEPLSNTSGMHRFVWDLRYNRPPALLYHYSIAALWDTRTPLEPRGMLVLPGKYLITLKVGKFETTQSLVIKQDPRSHESELELKEQFDFANKIDSSLSKLISVREEIENYLMTKKGTISIAIKDSLTAIADAGKNSFTSVINNLDELADAVESADAKPTQGQHNVFTNCKSISDELFTKWTSLRRIIPK